MKNVVIVVLSALLCLLLAIFLWTSMEQAIEVQELNDELDAMASAKEAAEQELDIHMNGYTNLAESYERLEAETRHKDALLEARLEALERIEEELSNGIEGEFNLYNFIQLKNSYDRHQEEISAMQEEIDNLKAVILDEKNVDYAKWEANINELEQRLADLSGYYRMALFAAAQSDHAFAEVIAALATENDMTEHVRWVTDNLELTEEGIIDKRSGDVLVLPDEDYYYYRQHIWLDEKYDSALDQLVVVYDVLDIETDERIYFIVTTFVKDDGVWKLDSVISTMEP